MKKNLTKSIIIVSSLLFIGTTGCITSNSKIKLTDTKTGNSVTISDQGFALDIDTLEKDGFKVEVVEVVETDE